MPRKKKNQDPDSDSHQVPALREDDFSMDDLATSDDSDDETFTEAAKPPSQRRKRISHPDGGLDTVIEKWDNLRNMSDNLTDDISHINQAMVSLPDTYADSMSEFFRKVLKRNNRRQKMTVAMSFMAVVIAMFGIMASQLSRHHEYLSKHSEKMIPSMETLAANAVTSLDDFENKKSSSKRPQKPFSSPSGKDFQVSNSIRRASKRPERLVKRAPIEPSRPKLVVRVPKKPWRPLFLIRRTPELAARDTLLRSTSPHIRPRWVPDRERLPNLPPFPTFE